jgi:hypothetical protein
MDEQLLSVSLVVMAVLELIKYGVRYFKKDPTLDFMPEFYALMIPFLSFVVGWLFGLIGWAEAVSMDWMYLLRWGLNIVITLIMYQMGLKPLKEYARAYNLKKSEDAASNQDII